jgi:elongation factor 3
MHDTKPQVADAAKTAMRKFCSLAGNEDIEPHIEIMVECMAHPESVPDTIKKLSATTFVQDMTGPALAVMIPLLCRALNERSTAILRPTALIIDNLCKLVKNPDDAGQFLPLLFPGLEKIIEMAAIPEVRELATKAKNTLQNVGGFTSHGHEDQESKLLELESDFSKHLSDVLSNDTYISSSIQISIEFVALIFSAFVTEEQFDDEKKWEKVVSNYLSPSLLPNVPLKPLYLSLFEKHRMDFEVCIRNC